MEHFRSFALSPQRHSAPGMPHIRARARVRPLFTPAGTNSKSWSLEAVRDTGQGGQLLQRVAARLLIPWSLVRAGRAPPDGPEGPKRQRRGGERQRRDRCAGENGGRRDQQDLLPGEDHQLDVRSGIAPGHAARFPPAGPPAQVSAGAGVTGPRPQADGQAVTARQLGEVCRLCAGRPVDSTTLTPAARAVRTASRRRGRSPAGSRICRPGPGRSDRFFP